jgi:hypothetical protein
MRKINQSQQIIYFFLILFLASSIYLFAIDSRYTDPKYNHDWFALSFADPKSSKLNFTIENFSSQTNFHWEIITDNTNVISQGDITIKSGEKKELSSSEIVSDKKMIVRVSDGTDTQEIYKNIKN